MDPIADRLNLIKPSPTLAITSLARQMRAEGRHVVGLGAGEPDFDTPLSIRIAAQKAMNEGDTRYTNVDGTPALKKAIADKFLRENELSYTADEITVGVGGKHVLYNILTASLNPQDEVIVCAPYWVSYPDMVLLSGGSPVIVPAQAPLYALPFDGIEKAITPRTRWIILNSPSNPTGQACTRKDLETLADILRTHTHVGLISDDIYEHLVYDDFRFSTFAQVAPDLKERCVTVNGVSKAYCMTGWRIGYAGGPKILMRAIAKVMSQSTSNPCSVAQAAAAEALNGPQDFIADHNDVFVQRRNLVRDALDAIPGLNCPNPQGAFYVYPSCEGLIGKTSPEGTRIDSDQTFARALLNEAGVAVVPGDAFGASPAFRVSYATSTSLLEEAMTLIARFCNRLS